jgi:hypothetical protein
MNNYPWFEVYRVALLELDRSKIFERITLARQKLKERMQMTGLTADEQHAIADALNNLYAVEVAEKNRGQAESGNSQDRNHVNQSRSATGPERTSQTAPTA